ncbi:MAG: hypothetical protein EOP04_18585 [Proteobacteria bacterium]|nr:MAG: hypothetical protein EOP04_18585 [Pseudomonadota bacterium]
MKSNALIISVLLPILLNCGGSKGGKTADGNTALPVSPPPVGLVGCDAAKLTKAAEPVADILKKDSSLKDADAIAKGFGALNAGIELKCLE